MKDLLQFTARWIVVRLPIRSERGASAIEYGIMVSLIAAVIVVAVVVLGKQTNSQFDCTQTAIGNNGATSC